MKKVLFFVSLLSSFLCYGQDYNTYGMEMLFSIPAGDGYNQIPFNWLDDGGAGPRRIAIDIKGYIYIGSSQNQLIMKYSEKGTHLETIPSLPLFTYSHEFWIRNNTVVVLGDSGVSIQDFTGKMIIEVQLDNIGIQGEEAYMINNHFFCMLPGSSLLSILNPGPDPDENNTRILNAEQTRALFLEPEKYGLEGVTIDNKNHLFLNGELQTRDYKTYFEHFEVNNKKVPSRLRNPSKFLLVSPIYLGKDQSRNVFWQVSSAVLIFDSLGKIVDFIIPEE